MRYTKIALLTFGAGLVLALVLVATETQGLERVASAAMALGIAAIPIGMAVDWRRATRAPRTLVRGGVPNRGHVAPHQSLVAARVRENPLGRTDRTMRPSPITDYGYAPGGSRQRTVKKSDTSNGPRHIDPASATRFPKFNFLILLRTQLADGITLVIGWCRKALHFRSSAVSPSVVLTI